MATITGVTFNFPPQTPAQAAVGITTVNYTYTLNCVGPECGNTTFNVTIDVVGVDPVLNTLMATGADAHPTPCPAGRRGVCSVVVTRSFVISTALLNEDTFTKDDIQLVVNALPVGGAGVRVTGESPVVQGNF